MGEKINRSHLWVPLLLLLISIIFTYFFIEEFTDATCSNNRGSLGFLVPFISLISLLYVRTFQKKFSSYLEWILQGLNLIFISFPTTIFLLMVWTMMV